MSMLGLRTHDLKNPAVAAKVVGTTLARAIGFRREPQISLLTDFGPDESTYAIRSAIRAVNPRARIEDICHSVPLGNILIGAWRLRRTVALPTEPEGTIYVAVVDPGVGSERRCIAVRTRQGKYLVGPDNGLLSLAAQTEGIDRAVAIENQELTLLQLALSRTFHGKDVFGPAAAHLARGIPLEELGPGIDPATLQTIRLELELSDERRAGSIVDIDAFGNVRTDIPNHLPERVIGRQVPFKLRVGILEVDARARLVRTFAECQSREPALILSSTGSLDLVVNLGSATSQFNLPPEQIGLDADLRPTARIELNLANVA